jgi:hypothetical protein
MRFLLMHRIDERQPDAYTPSRQIADRVGELIGHMTKAGVLLVAEGVRHSSEGARVRSSAGRRIVRDGPFAEAKEVIGGFLVIDVRSKDEAIEWAGRLADAIGDIEVEIRRITEDCPPPVAAGAD